MAKDKIATSGVAAAAKKVTVLQDAFITAFYAAAEAGHTCQDVAKALNLGLQSVKAREKSYREKGVKLPVLKQNGRGRKVDIGAANALIEKLAAEAKAKAEAEKAEQPAA